MDTRGDHMESMERKGKLKKLLAGDEIYRAYADSVRELIKTKKR